MPTRPHITTVKRTQSDISLFNGALNFKVNNNTLACLECAKRELPVIWKRTNRKSEHAYSGIGIALNQTAAEPHSTTVKETLKNGPADLAGIVKGERIVMIDGKSIRNETLEAIVNKLKGQTGSTVTFNDTFVMALYRQQPLRATKLI